MKCTAVLIDARPGFMRAATTPPSLLTLPFGMGSVLDSMVPSLRKIVQDDYHVCPRFVVSQEYRAALGPTGSNGGDRVITDIESLLASAEPTDWFLLFDVSRSLHIPVDQIGAGLYAPDPRCVTNLIAIRGPLTVREEVLADHSGQVHRIQRYYDGVTDTQRTRQVATLVSCAVLGHVRDAGVQDLLELREALVRRAIPQRDNLYRAQDPAPDTAAGFLGSLWNHLKTRPSVQGHLDRRVRVGRDAAIDETAQLHGMVIVQDGARIEGHARIVGPALIGQGARVGRGAVITHGLIGPRAVVPSQACLHRRVFLAGMDPADEGGPQAGGFGDDEEEGASDALADVPTADDRRVRYLYLKRVADAALAAGGLVLLAPLFLGTAALIKLTSPGPVLYGDRREGQGGREFRCWKFRTMVADAAAKQRAMYVRSELDGPQFKVEGDTRVTWLGRWLRATNIDELPQLFNVLRGEMSLIGPRPSPFRENQICVPWRQARLAVRPGITGLWQMCRRDRELGDFHQWIRYDLLYVRHLSARLDATIMAATLVTLGGRRPLSLNWFLSRREQENEGRVSGSLPLRIPMLEQVDSAEAVNLATVRLQERPSCVDGQQRQAFLGGLQAIALDTLPRMFMPEQCEFVHSLRRRNGALVPVGRSLRYTAMVLIGLREVEKAVAGRVLHGVDPDEVLDHLIGALPQMTDLGDAAVIYWAACRWQHPRRGEARECMASLLRFGASLKTVHVAWCLSACCAEPQFTSRSGALGYRLADLLLSAFNGAGSIFPYRTGRPQGLRSHVTSFADQVYPILALARYYGRTRCPAALDVASRTADRICRHQGANGQWWWHYDARNEEVIERYPVYAVHQDAMAPMALNALVEEGGPCHDAEVARGLDWLRSAEELSGGSLVDNRAGVIWRKVARREPWKLARTVQSLAARARAGWHVPGVETALPPRCIDHECRPYHLGWFLKAWASKLAEPARTEVEVKIA